MQGGTKSPKARGRPRQFDPALALAAAGATFWTKGFAATSLDDLVAATGMNRPSLYNAFGDKEAIYRLALDHFVEQMQRASESTLFDGSSLRDGLRNFFDAALDVYFSSDPAPGCLVMCTAPAEALERPEVRAFLAAVVRQIDRAFAARFRLAVEAGESLLDPAVAARMAQAVLHSVAIRARAGASKASLRKMSREAVDLLCG